MSVPARPKLAMAWAAGCGGCEVALLNLGEGLVALEEAFEIVFFPCLADHKLEDLERLPDRSIDLCLLDGAIRTEADVALARLLRARSKLLVAFGSCADEGCVPALANLGTVRQTLEGVYGTEARRFGEAAETEKAGLSGRPGAPGLPRLLDSVFALGQVVPVDYAVPGCPPEPATVRFALETLASAIAGRGELPPVGTALGAKATALCEECPLPRREEVRVDRFVRPHEATPRPAECLLEQGLACLGPVTRGGCGAPCPAFGLGCRGCYGALAGVEDVGAKMVDALAAVLRTGGAGEVGAAARHERDAAAAARTLVDPAGTFYRHGLARSILAHDRGARSLRAALAGRTPLAESGGEHVPDHD